MATGGLAINFSTVLKQLEGGIYLDLKLLRNNISKFFRWQILYYRKKLVMKRFF